MYSKATQLLAKCTFSAWAQNISVAPTAGPQWWCMRCGTHSDDRTPASICRTYRNCDWPVLPQHWSASDHKCPQCRSTNVPSYCILKAKTHRTNKKSKHLEDWNYRFHYFHLKLDESTRQQIVHSNWMNQHIILRSSNCFLLHHLAWVLNVMKNVVVPTSFIILSDILCVSCKMKKVKRRVLFGHSRYIQSIHFCNNR